MKSTCTWSRRRAIIPELSASLITGVLVLLCGLSSRAAEDPARFQAVTNWYATFTRTLHSSGTYTLGNCTYNWSFSHSGGISSRLISLPGLDMWTDLGTTNASVALSIQDTGRETCGDFPTTYAASTPGLLQISQGGTVTIDVNSTNYTLQPGYLVFPIKNTVDGDPFPDTAINWFPFYQLFINPIVEPLPASGMVLQGTRRYPLNQLDYQDAGVLTIASSGSPLGATGNMMGLNGELVLTWTLTPFIEEVEVVIESDQYEEWLPTGDLRDWNKRGKDILFVTGRLRLKDRPEEDVPQSRAKWFKFELSDVSSEPGVCMNRPISQSANTNPDLRFENSVNRPPLIVPALTIQDEGMTAKTPDDEYVAVVAGISSFDFGAYGKLKVTAEVNGREIVGYWENDPAREPKPLLLPRRQPESKVADKWKEDNQVGGVGDTDDDEDDPVGDGHAGDGLSLYEEYRGFSENLKHVRSNPQKKDLFIADRIGNADSKTGVAILRAQSGLEVHGKMRAEEFNVSLASGAYSSFLNFNHSGDGRHIVDQHGLIILAKASSDGVSRADGPSQGGTPGFYQRIFVDRAAYGWQNVGGGSGPRILTFKGAGTIAHELAHACAVWHHGDTDEQKVVWAQQGETIRENLLEIEPRLERGGPFPPPFGTNGSRTVWIAVPQGQHSGRMDCLMRYANAYAYRSRRPGENKVRYVVDEIEGIVLCESPDGTGVNGPDWIPHSRYGPAAGGRGNCKEQICVNDRYGHHNR